MRENRGVEREGGIIGKGTAEMEERKGRNMRNKAKEKKRDNWETGGKSLTTIRISGNQGRKKGWRTGGTGRNGDGSRGRATRTTKRMGRSFGYKSEASDKGFTGRLNNTEENNEGNGRSKGQKRKEKEHSGKRME